MQSVLAAMRKFPQSMEVQFSCTSMIILDSYTVPGAEPMHPEFVKYHHKIFKGIGLALVAFCIHRCNPMFTMLTCDAL